MGKQRSEPFAATVARLTARPARPEPVVVGRRGDVWGVPWGVRYRLLRDDLSPGEVVALARAGARVVYDACGCGGAECELDWLSGSDVLSLVAAGRPPRPASSGRADLEHWRSEAGGDLVVLAVAVRWGERI